MNVGKDTTLCNGDVTEKLVQFFVVSNGELEMTWDDTGLLVITGSIASQLEDFGSEVFENSREVNGRTWLQMSGNSTRNRWEIAYQHQHVEHSCPFSGDGEHDRRGKRDQLWMND